jgi:hypothetical protein
MVKEIRLMREQQAHASDDSALVQRKAMIDAQNNAAQLGMTQSNNAAMQDLARMQQYQQTLDANALAQNQSQASAMGHDVVGGSFDVNAANQARLANLAGAASAYTPSVYNLAGSNLDVPNPAMASVAKSAGANKFIMPQTGDLKLGGY